MKTEKQWMNLTKNEDLINKISYILSLPDSGKLREIKDFEVRRLNENELLLYVIALREQ